MYPVMTVAEMEKAFASEWVLVDEPKTDKYQRVRKGKVLYHSPDRDEVYRKAIELRPKRFAFLYTGALPKDMVLVQ